MAPALSRHRRRFGGGACKALLSFRAVAGNFATSKSPILNQAYASPDNAIFNVAGVSTVPAITPILNVASGLSTTRFDLYSLFVTPLFAEGMTLRFTPFAAAGIATSLLLDQGAGAPFEVTLARSDGPVRLTFPSAGNGTFRGISNVRIDVVSTTGAVRPPLATPVRRAWQLRMGMWA